MGVPLGYVAKLYFLSTGTRATWGAVDATTGYHSGPAPTNLTEITLVQDLEITTDNSAWEGTTRGNGGYKGFAATLTEISYDIPVLFDASNAAVAALLKADVNKTSIALAQLSQDKATVGAVGTWADYVVTQAKKGEKLAEGQTIVFSVKPYAFSAVAPERIIVASS